MTAPFTAAHTLFQAPEPQHPPKVDPAVANAAIGQSGDRVTCRWCLHPFDAREQQRAIWERGRLRTNLMMADNGSELVCCDACWPGAFGQPTLMMGKVVPGDPNQVGNMLLRRYDPPRV